MVRSIFKRIVVGVGIALVLMLIKGSLIANVHAEVYTISKNDGSNFSSCTNCNSLTYDWNYDIGLNSSGFLYFNALVYGTYGGTSYIPTFANARVKVNDIWYSCSITNSSQINDYNNVNYITNNASMHCPIKFKNSSIIQTIQLTTVGQGVEGISLYSPISYVEDSSSAITEQIEESTNQQIESQKVCNIYSKDNIKIDAKYLTNGGAESSSSNWGITGYIRLNNSSKIIVKSTQSVNGNTCFYDNDKGLISCTPNSGLNVDSEVAIPNNSSFVRFSINKSTNTPQFQVCSNGNQSVADSNEQLNDTLSDNNISSGTSSTIDSLLGNNNTTQDTFGPVADLLLLPLTLFRAFYSGFGGTCSTFTLGTLFNHTLTMPCIDLRSILGNAFYNTLDMAICLFMIYNFILLCIDIFDRITSFDDPFNDLYSPKHTYHGRHESGGAYHG